MKPPRVLIIISGFAIEGPLGGIERFGLELAQTLDRSLVTPIVCGLWAYGTPYERRWMEQLAQQGIPAFMTADWQADAPYRSFRQAMTRIQAELAGQGTLDIIHSHTQFGDLAAMLLRRRYRARALVRTVHNEREWPRRPERRLLLTNFLLPLFFRAEIGVAQQVVDNLNSRPVARLLGRRALRMYNALNISRFDDVQVDRAARLASLGVPAGARLVGSVGRLAEQKGYTHFVSAATQVLAAVPDVYFLLVGSGELESTLQAQVQAAGLADRFILAGPRPDVEELLVCLDLFVSSSLWEGLPTVIMESMAARVPVVATSVAGNRELIRPGETGILVHPGDNDELARAIIATLDLPLAARANMTDAAFDYVKQNFSIQSVARQHELLYCQLVAN
jgi:glycosyltransferase involved in cell wall biosynthesis